MGLETGSFINDLDVTNPTSTDKRKQGDDHLRLIKTVLKGSFPSSSKAWYNPSSVSKTANYSVVAADMNKTILCDTSGGSFTLTMPTLVSGDAGWECTVIKTTTDTNPVFIAPPSGTIQSGEYSGLAKCRRCIPGRRTKVLWTGTAWIAERVCHDPIGTVHSLSLGGTTLPVGYEWANGQTLSSASTNYPEFYAANGNSGVVLDLRGRTDAGRDDMGGSAAGRLSTSYFGTNGQTVGDVGGEESHTLTISELASHTHTGTTGIESAAHTHGFTAVVGTTSQFAAGGNPVGAASPTGSNTGSESANHTHSFTTNSKGSDGAHNNVQPTIITNKIIVVE